MPYGIKNESPEQTNWMERCVSSVMKANPKYPESRAIAICKAQLKKNNWKVKKGEAELSMKEELWELEKKIREAITGPIKEKEQVTWVADIFDDFIIVEKGDKLYKLEWSISGDTVTVNWDSVVEVKRRVVYDPVSQSSIKIPNIKGQHRRLTWGPTTI
jgi:hypothetical protein